MSKDFNYELSFDPNEESGLNPKKEYLNLLNQRISLEKQADNIWVKYVKEFGDFMTRNLKLTIECIKYKKMLSEVFKRKAIGEKFDFEKIRRDIQVTLSSFYDELNNINDIKDCELKPISDHEGILVKKLFREIVNMIHPDVRPELFAKEIIRELWEAANYYYKCNNLDKLQEIDFIILQELEQIGVDIDTDNNIENLEEKIKKVKAQIDKIINSAPYLLKFILNNEEEKKLKTQYYIDEINVNLEYLKELKQELKQYGIDVEKYVEV